MVYIKYLRWQLFFNDGPGVNLYNNIQAGSWYPKAKEWIAIRTERKCLLASVVLAFLFALLLSSRPAQAATYTVQPGDTLYLIGQRYKIGAWELQLLNGLPDTWIYPGQVLWIPDGQGRVHVVSPGDTLFLIGQWYGVPYQDIMWANGLSDSYIYPGQALWIPTGGTQAAPSPASRGSTASRGGITYSAQDVDLLARLVYAEARGEPYAGQVAVAAVVLNRVRDGRFPNTIAGVIYEPDAFECVTNGQFWLQPNTTAYQAAREALAGSDPSGGALFFWNPATATSPWVWTRQITTVIGNHVFAI